MWMKIFLLVKDENEFLNDSYKLEIVNVVYQLEKTICYAFRFICSFYFVA
jgi:hypothetical protein